MIEFRDIHKRYADGTRAVDGVSLSIPESQFCVLLGSSGAGKSTLLKMINGMVEPTSGELLVTSEALNGKTRSRIQRRVAMIHQHFNLVARLSVETNILSGAIATVPAWRIFAGAYPAELRRRAALLAEEMGLSEVQFHRRCADLSGGQQQRVGIARAFLLQPPVVLADEPVASLDPATSNGVLEALRHTARENRATVVCSLHQVDLARAFADRIVGMRDGRVVFDGSPEALDTTASEALYARAGS